MVQTGVQIVEVEPEFAGQRIDNYLMRILKGVPKSRIYRILRKGEVRRNGGRIKPEGRLAAGDQIRIPPIRTADEKRTDPNSYWANNIEKTIIYESKLLLIINKPTGLAVHGGSGISQGVIESLRLARPNERHLELVHRLDRDTSGCLMVAKRRSYLRLLQQELHGKQKLGKYYRLVTHGHWPSRKVRIEAPLIKNTLQSGERVTRVSDDGKPCVTTFKVLARGAGLSYIEAVPVTGRTHQIRVHCQHAGHPILGDPKYGFPDADSGMQVGRLMLHASALSIPALGEHEAVSVTAPMDSTMQKTVEIFKYNN